ncbi:MAG TPA: hypothetical protein PKW90_17200 [Myxococcota bacterium]|nr:hypothetical protein [Myxococcota bacterium]
MINAKNQIQELLAGLGLPINRAVYTHTQAGVGAWTSTLVVTLPDRPPLTGTGTAMRKSQADIAAAADAIAKLEEERGLAGQNWALMYAEAQAGDALLKLAGYLNSELTSPESRSRWLQLHESDASLSQVFDRWFDQGDPDLAAYGRGLGEKNKATVVEALLWRRYGTRVLGPGAMEALAELRVGLTRE